VKFVIAFVTYCISLVHSILYGIVVTVCSNLCTSVVLFVLLLYCCIYAWHVQNIEYYLLTYLLKLLTSRWILAKNVSFFDDLCRRRHLPLVCFLRNLISSTAWRRISRGENRREKVCGVSWWQLRSSQCTPVVLITIQVSFVCMSSATSLRSSK